VGTQISRQRRDGAESGAARLVRRINTCLIKEIDGKFAPEREYSNGYLLAIKLVRKV